MTWASLGQRGLVRRAAGKGCWREAVTASCRSRVKAAWALRRERMGRQRRAQELEDRVPETAEMLLGPWCPGGCWAWGRGGEARPGVGSKHWGVWTSDEAYTGRTSNRTTHTLKKLGFCVRRWKWVYANVKGDVPKSQCWGPHVWVEWSRSDVPKPQRWGPRMWVEWSWSDVPKPQRWGPRVWVEWSRSDVPKSQRWGPRVWVERSRSDQKTGVAGLSRDS